MKNTTEVDARVYTPVKCPSCRFKTRKTTNPRRVFSELRDHIEKKHPENLDDFLIGAELSRNLNNCRRKI